MAFSICNESLRTLRLRMCFIHACILVDQVQVVAPHVSCIMYVLQCLCIEGIVAPHLYDAIKCPLEV